MRIDNLMEDETTYRRDENGYPDEFGVSDGNDDRRWLSIGQSRNRNC